VCLEESSALKGRSSPGSPVADVRALDALTQTDGPCALAVLRFLSRLPAQPRQPWPTPLLTLTWPSALDRVVIAGYADSPELFDAHHARLPPAARLGLALVHLRLGRKVPRSVADKLIAGLAETHVYFGLAPTIALVDDGRLSEQPLYDDSGLLGPTFYALLEGLSCSPRHWATALAEVARKRPPRLAARRENKAHPLQRYRDALPHLDWRHICILLRALGRPYGLSGFSFSEQGLEQLYRVLLEVRRDSPLNLLKMANRLSRASSVTFDFAPGHRPNEAQPVLAEVCAVCALTRSPTRDIAKKVLPYVRFHSESLRRPECGHEDASGAENRLLSAVALLPVDERRELLRKIIADEGLWPRLFYGLSLCPEPEFVDSAETLVDRHGARDPGTALLAVWGFASLGIAWLPYLVKRSSRATTAVARDILSCAVLRLLRECVGRDEPYPPYLDRFVCFHGEHKQQESFGESWSCHDLTASLAVELIERLPTARAQPILLRELGRADLEVLRHLLSAVQKHPTAKVLTCVGKLLGDRASRIWSSPYVLSTLLPQIRRLPAAHLRPILEERRNRRDTSARQRRVLDQMLAVVRQAKHGDRGVAESC
jgi:hypothetical protein